MIIIITIIMIIMIIIIIIIIIMMNIHTTPSLTYKALSSYKHRFSR